MIESPIQVVVDFLDHFEKPERLVFGNPVKIISATSLSEILPALSSVESAVSSGCYAAGFISYEAAPAFDSALEAKELTDFPLLWFGIFDQPLTSFELPKPASPAENTWSPEITTNEYDRAIDYVQRAIAGGETYQTNYTFRLRSKLDCDALAYYNHLVRAHPCPYSAYIDTGAYEIISNSPELFLSLDNRMVKSRPMKGTIIRGRWQEEDAVLRCELESSVKDRAEHVMIVDLMRSDLGKVAQVGSVTVPEAFTLQKLPTVWQMTSLVSCTLAKKFGLTDLLRASFPPGSVTGAPKARTMEIIKEQEFSPRKVYCGTIGCLKPDGSAVFNVPIRTVVVDKSTKLAECGVGGGITSGSNSAAEYAEACTKSLFLSSKEEDFKLLESLLCDHGRYFLLQRHLKRLQNAACFFGFFVDVNDIKQALLSYANAISASRSKVRAVVNKDGTFNITSETISELIPQRVALAKSAINTQTPFIFHKTTNRWMYDEHKNLRPDVYDVILYNDDGDLTEFVNGNIVLEIAGARYTPLVSAGLLAGTLRDELLLTQEIVERKLAIADLYRAEQLWLINGVRGWVPVTLVD